VHLKTKENNSMSFSTTVQPVSKPVTEKPQDNGTMASLMGAVMLSVYAANKSTKAFRKMKRRFLWTSFKLKAKSLFSKKAVSDQTLIYILLGVIFLVLIFYAWPFALLLAAVALILILTHVI
jgi:hypothetical protein